MATPRRRNAQELIRADHGSNAGAQFSQHQVAREMAQLVVDHLEVVDIDQHQRQWSVVAHGSNHLSLNEIVQVATVMDLRQPIEHGQPIDFFVILRLNVTTREKSVEAVPDPQIVPVAQHPALGSGVVDEGSVCASQIRDAIFPLLIANDQRVVTTLRGTHPES